MCLRPLSPSYLSTPRGSAQWWVQPVRATGECAYLACIEVEDDSSGHLGDEEQQEEGKILGADGEESAAAR
jgi:hypothetical protein